MRLGVSDASTTLPEPTSPLAIGDFRRYWLARFFAVFATMSMVVLIGYQAYDIARADYGYSRSEGAFLLGLLGLAQFVVHARRSACDRLAGERFTYYHDRCRQF